MRAHILHANSNSGVKRVKSSQGRRLPLFEQLHHCDTVDDDGDGDDGDGACDDFWFSRKCTQDQRWETNWGDETMRLGQREVVVVVCC